MSEDKSILESLSEPLSKDDVELRIGTTSAKGFSLLLYKTARTDVKRLNKVCGLNWSNKHFYDHNGLLCCTISIFDKVSNQWIDRTDVGVESFTEKEKGSYSDSFKRAGFRWGIGLELYQSPFIWINWEMKPKQSGKGYDPVNFYQSNMEITNYGVDQNGKPYLNISYGGKEIYKSGYKTQSKQTEDDKTKYWNEFSSICKNLSVEPKDFLSEWCQIDLLDKAMMLNTVSKFLKDKDILAQQIDNFKAYKAQ